jgi:hypothetical protein
MGRIMKRERDVHTLVAAVSFGDVVLFGVCVGFALVTGSDCFYDDFGMELCGRDER